MPIKFYIWMGLLQFVCAFLWGIEAWAHPVGSEVRELVGLRSGVAGLTGFVCWGIAEWKDGRDVEEKGE